MSETSFRTRNHAEKPRGEIDGRDRSRRTNYAFPGGAKDSVTRNGEEPGGWIQVMESHYNRSKKLPARQGGGKSNIPRCDKKRSHIVFRGGPFSGSVGGS